MIVGTNLKLNSRELVLLRLILGSLERDDGTPMYQGPISGPWDVWCRDAVLLFQGAVGHLTVSGAVDTATWAAILAAGQSILDTMLEDDGDPLTWEALPDGVVRDLLELSDACVEHGTVYGPGRGYYDPKRNLWIVTQGPFGPDSARYKTKRRGPAFVCSSWTYFALMYVLMRWIEFPSHMAGAQPALSKVLQTKPGTHHWKKSGPWYGAADWFERVTANGNTQGRNARAKRGFLDLLEVWKRVQTDPLSFPEVSFWEWASWAKGWVHHTALVLVDRATGFIYFIDAGGWKDRNGVFSGTLMDIQVIRTREQAEAFAKKGWGRCWGMTVSSDLHLARSRPMPGLAFETQPGQIEIVREAA